MKPKAAGSAPEDITEQVARDVIEIYKNYPSVEAELRVRAALGRAKEELEKAFEEILNEMHLNTRVQITDQIARELRVICENFTVEEIELMARDTLDRAKEELEKARKSLTFGKAAQAWCTSETMELVMVPELAEAFAEILYKIIQNKGAQR